MPATEPLVLQEQPPEQAEELYQLGQGGEKVQWPLGWSARRYEIWRQGEHNSAVATSTGSGPAIGPAASPIWPGPSLAEAGASPGTGHEPTVTSNGASTAESGKLKAPPAHVVRALEAAREAESSTTRRRARRAYQGQKAPPPRGCG